MRRPFTETSRRQRMVVVGEVAPDSSAAASAATLMTEPGAIAGSSTAAFDEAIARFVGGSIKIYGGALVCPTVATTATTINAELARHVEKVFNRPIQGTAARSPRCAAGS